MPFQKAENGLEYFHFNDSPFTDTLHGFFTRDGGVSPVPFNSLNLSTSNGDEVEHIRENQRRIFSALERPINSLFDVWQVHSTNVICTDKPRNRETTYIKADAIFTNNPEVTLLMRFADCVPILIFDPIKNVVGIIHAGWQGTVNNIVNDALQEIRSQYHCDSQDIVAAIGPSIGPDHYEIGRDVYSIAHPIFENCDGVFQSENGRIMFDLWKANAYLLNRAGVNKILISNLCTACDTDRWYSHRAENGKTGRFGVVIGLRG